MSAKSKKQLKMIYAKRGQYIKKDNTPEDWKWIWYDKWIKDVNMKDLPKKVEENSLRDLIRSMIENEIEGGKGDDHTEDEVDQDQLQVGIEVEYEHTNDKDKAKEIAIDHLIEDEEYYTKLIKAGLVDEPNAINKAKELGIYERIIREVIRKEIIKEIWPCNWGFELVNGDELEILAKPKGNGKNHLIFWVNDKINKYNNIKKFIKPKDKQYIEDLMKKINKYKSDNENNMWC